MITWNPAIHPRDHAVPVEQHVEGHDGRHDEQADDTEKRHARVPDRGEYGGDESGAGCEQRIQAVAQILRIDAEAPLDPFGIETGDQRLQAAEVFRRLVQEIAKLRRQQRNQDDRARSPNSAGR